ncbi:MAG: hypothetical protein ACE5KE_00275 [Methanosarcinales archaeon]
MRKFLLLISLIFLLFAVPSFAYVSYNPNTYYTSDINHVWFLNRNYEQPDLKCWEAEWNSSGYFQATNKNCDYNDTEIFVVPIGEDLFVESNNSSTILDYENIWEVSANKQVIVSLRSMLNDTSNIFPPSENRFQLRLIVLDDDGNVLEYNVKIVNYSAGVWRDDTIVGKAYNEKTWVRAEVGIPKWINTRVGSMWQIDTFDVYTIDDISSQPDISDEFVKNTCNASGTVTTLVSESGIEQDNKAVKIKYIERADNILCGTYLLDKTAVTRRILQNRTHGLGDKSNINWFIARDLAYVDEYAISNGARYNRLLFDKIFSGIVRATHITPKVRGDQPTGCYNLEFSDGGSVNQYNILSNVSFRDFYRFTGTAGDKWRFNGLTICGGFVTDGSDSNYQDNFQLSCLGIAQYYCVGNTQFTLDTSCNLVNETDCEWWGCQTPEGAGKTCDIGIIGKYCVNNFTVREVNSSGYILQEYVCPYNTTCYNGECLTEEEIYQRNTTAFEKGVGYVSGLTRLPYELSLWLVMLLIALISSGAIVYKLGITGTSAGLIFAISLNILIIAFAVIGWLPVWIPVVFIIISAILVTRMLLQAFTAGG